MIDLSASVRQKIGELLAKLSSPHGQLRGGRQGMSLDRRYVHSLIVHLEAMNLARSGRPPPLNLDRMFRNKVVHWSITQNAPQEIQKYSSSDRPLWAILLISKIRVTHLS